MSIIVKYNSTTLSPTPLISRSEQFIDYGTRWGNIEQIELAGFLTGISSTGSILNLTNVFTGQFGKLEVLENSTPIFTWNTAAVEEISLQNSYYQEGTFVPYTVKLHAYDGLPSGIADPSNEYSFNHGDDGIVTVTHKISARGIKNSVSALNNAIAFVKTFTGKNPYTACVPAFVPNNSGVWMSVSESIDRTNTTYSVNETFKYNTGVNQSFIENFSLGITDVVEDEYLRLDVALKMQGSPMERPLATVTSVSGANLLQRIAGFDIATGLLIRNAYNIASDSGAFSWDIKASYISGYNSDDVSGFFNYEISYDKSHIIPETNWKIDGEFSCKGPLDFRRTRLSSFKTENGPNWDTYLINKLTGSSIFATYGSKIPPYVKWTIQENTGLAIFKLSLSTVDETGHASLINPKYSVEVSPTKWVYEFLPSANIEGHYVVQDPNMRTQSKIRLSISADRNALTQNTILTDLATKMTELKDIYVSNGVLVHDEISSGNFTASHSQEWLGLDTFSSGILYTKVVGSNMYDFIRAPGFKFGY